MPATDETAELTSGDTASTSEEGALRIAVVGTLPPPVCGTTVSLQLLIDQLRQQPGVTALVVDTGRIRGQGIQMPWRFGRMVMRLWTAVRAADIVTVHLCPLAIPLLVPWVLLLARLHGKPVILRLFGGQDFRDFPGSRGRLQRWASGQCDVYLAQTQRLVRSATEAGLQQVHWFPTSRPDPVVPAPPLADRCTRFVYLGWVKSTKGVPLILEAAQDLSDKILIDIYGPFDGMSQDDFQEQRNVRYRGVLAPGTAIEKLAEYDALLLPTHWEGEGYPGVILEAFQAGRPVITTRFRDIPEIVDPSCGLLIEPHSTRELRDAMERLHADPQTYHRLAAGAARKAEMFRGSVWAVKLIEICRAAIARGRQPATRHI